MVVRRAAIGANVARTLQRIVTKRIKGQLCQRVTRGQNLQGRRNQRVQIFGHEQLGALGADIGNVQQCISLEFALHAE